MAWAAVVAGGVALGSSVYKGVKANQQLKKAEQLRGPDPGYQVNQGVIDNAKTLSDQYGNYQLPGYSQMLGGINSNFATAFQEGSQGATSGGDILDLATRMAYGKNQALTDLNVRNSQGKQQALYASLNANAAAGQEYQNKNAYDREKYLGRERESAALTQAGETNMFNAVDSGLSVLGKFATSQLGGAGDSSAASTATSGGNDLYNKYYFPNGSPKFDALGNAVQPAATTLTGGSDQTWRQYLTPSGLGY